MNVSNVKSEFAVKFCEKVCHPPLGKPTPEKKGYDCSTEKTVLAGACASATVTCTA
jgi:hypothetical protein